MIGSVTTDFYDDSATISSTIYYYVVREGDATGAELCQSNEVSASVSNTCIPEFPSCSSSNDDHRILGSHVSHKGN